MKRGLSPVEAVKAALPRLRGAFALAFLFAGEENLADRRAPGLAAGDRFRRGCDVCRLRCDRACAFYRHGELSGGRRLRHPQPRRRRNSRCRRQTRPSHRAEVASFDHAHRQGQPSPFHGEGDPRAAGSRRSYACALSRHGGRARGAADGAAVRFPRAETHFDRRLRHGLLRRHGRRAIGSSASRTCRSKSISPRSSATATFRSIPARSRSSSRSPARPPIRWRRCATRASTASTSFPSSTCRPRPSPAKATS